MSVALHYDERVKGAFGHYEGIMNASQFDGLDALYFVISSAIMKHIG